jgi:hypothetical protein
MAFRGRLEQTGIQSQARDQTDLTADGRDQFQCGEAAVGDDHHATVRQPAFAL